MSGRWIGGLAEWEEGNTTFLSIAFTWTFTDEVYHRCGCEHRTEGA